MTTTLGPNDDAFAGTAGPDSVLGGGGNDSLAGAGGADFLAGDLPGNGDDSLSGGADNDTLFGGNGGDTLDGGDGDDQLYGEPGNDLIEGGDGDDTAFAGDGNDTMNGGNGRDFFIADGGGDLLMLGEADDVGFGGGGGDSLAGGNGNDFLFGDAGADTLRGEAGNDRLHADGDDAIVDGGDGVFDTLVPIAGIAAIDLSNAANQNAGGSGPVVTGVEAVDASIADGPVSIAGAAFGAFGNVLFGSAFADTIAGSTLADIILGNAGNDVIAGGGGDDTLIADQGNDTVEGGLGDDQALLPGDPGDWTQSQQGELAVFTNAASGRAVSLRNVQSIFFDGPAQDQVVELGIADINAAPAASDASFTIAENSASGTAVGTVAATDPDDGDVLAFAIAGGNALGAFAIDPDSGAISVANAAALDFETNPGFTLTVLVTDSGGNTETATVTIALTDMNEIGTNQPPVASDAAFALAENAAAGTAVGTVVATDPDAGDAPHFEIAGGNAGNAFAIDPVTGAITVANPAALDFEAMPAFALTVVATDGGGLSDAATITVNLTNVNEQPTIADAAFAIAENLATGTFVGTVTASDPDAGDVRSFAIIAGNTGGAFAIHVATGIVSVANQAALDFETNPAFALTIAVNDGGGLADTATVTIALADVNEGGGNAAPVAITLSAATAPENAPGAAVGTLAAIDPDIGDTHTFALLPTGDAAAFAIVGDELRVGAAGLNFESGIVRNVTIRATDAGGLSVDMSFPIVVTNVNEPPAASDASYAIAENSAVGTNVGTPIAVIDVDAGDDATFDIVAGNALGGFIIDPNSGQIRVADPDVLDFETNPQLTLTVRVTDDGGLTDTATVTIELTDVDDSNQPPSIDAQSFAASETVAGGANVGTAAASDPNGGPLAYSITGGSGMGVFAINAGSGLITTAAALNFEATASYTLTVRVTDNGGLSDSATITVNVTDVNEPPVANDQSFSVDENSANGTVVGTVVATDPDAGSVITYSITGGNASGAFTINGGTGQITVADSSDLDFETAPSFVLIVQASSNGGLTDTASVTINVNDVDEAINGTSGPDPLVGTSAPDSINGLAGNDTIRGGAGNDTIDGGADADLLDYSDASGGFTFALSQGAGPFSSGDLSAAGLGTDSYANMEGAIGGGGGDSLTGSAAGDVLAGGNGNDTLDGGEGGDTLTGGNDNDSVVAGGGGDRIVAASGDGDDFYDGGSGTDTLDLSGATGNVSLDFRPDEEVVMHSVTGGGLGTDIFERDSVEVVIGSPFNDNLFVRGSGLADTVFAGAGNDSIILNSGDDLGFGEDGNDSFVGSLGNDTIDGGNGNDQIEGRDQRDSMTGGPGNDIFRFQGEIEFDTLLGGDIITDFAAGTSSTTVDRFRFDEPIGLTLGDGDGTVDNFRSGNDAAINLAGTEVGVKTDTAAANDAAIRALIDGYTAITSGALFVFFDSGKDHAVLYYDANPAAAGGAFIAANLTNIVDIAGLGNFDAGDFLFD